MAKVRSSLAGYVMATGNSKRVLFVLPAVVLLGRVTIVVMLLNLLKGNLRDHCKELGTACAM